MPSLNFFWPRFTPPRWACWLAAFGVLLFSSLGYWQLQRAAEKRHILQAITTATQANAQTWQRGDPLPPAFYPLRLTGHFLPALFLLDNQPHNHQFGFQVLSPFVVDNATIILIDRGWVACDPRRVQLPTIHTPLHTVTLQGHVYYPAVNAWVLGPAYEVKSPRITIIEHLNLNLISDFLHKSVNPFIIRLSPEMPYGYQRSWSAVSMPPERHLGYAVQWFSMAIVTLILLITLNTKKRHDEI